MTKEEIKNLRDQAEVLLYRLMEAGVRQHCAKNLIVSATDSCTYEYARHKLHMAIKDAGEIRDMLWDLYLAGTEFIPDKANQYEFLIQKLWGTQRAIRRKEHDLINTHNPVMVNYLRHELKEKNSELLANQFEIYNFLENLAEKQ